MAEINSKVLDIEDRISAKAHQLHALLEHTIGDAGPVFQGLTPDLQSAYHLTCAELAEAVVDGLEEIGRLRLAARDMAH